MTESEYQLKPQSAEAFAVGEKPRDLPPSLLDGSTSSELPELTAFHGKATELSEKKPTDISGQVVAFRTGERTYILKRKVPATEEEARKRLEEQRRRNEENQKKREIGRRNGSRKRKNK